MARPTGLLLLALLIVLPLVSFQKSNAQENQQSSYYCDQTRSSRLVGIWRPRQTFFGILSLSLHHNQTGEVERANGQKQAIEWECVGDRLKLVTLSPANTPKLIVDEREIAVLSNKYLSTKVKTAGVLLNEDIDFERR